MNERSGYETLGERGGDRSERRFRQQR